MKTLCTRYYIGNWYTRNIYYERIHIYIYPSRCIFHMLFQHIISHTYHIYERIHFFVKLFTFHILFRGTRQQKVSGVGSKIKREKQREKKEHRRMLYVRAHVTKARHSPGPRPMPPPRGRGEAPAWRRARPPSRHPCSRSAPANLPQINKFNPSRTLLYVEQRVHTEYRLVSAEVPPISSNMMAT